MLPFLHDARFLFSRVVRNFQDVREKAAVTDLEKDKWTKISLSFLHTCICRVPDDEEEEHHHQTTTHHFCLFVGFRFGHRKERERELAHSSCPGFLPRPPVQPDQDGFCEGREICAFQGNAGRGRRRRRRGTLLISRMMTTTTPAA